AATAALGIAPARAAAPAVMTRPIPRSGEPLPVIGIGTAIVFDIEDDTARREERARVIRALIDRGGRLIDTAPSYGSAETVVGDLLAALKARDRIFLATKFRVRGRDGATAEMKESLKRLRTDRVDLMQRHNIGFVDRKEAADHLALA